MTPGETGGKESKVNFKPRRGVTRLVYNSKVVFFTLKNTAHQSLFDDQQVLF
jgi:hypothetical protein